MEELKSTGRTKEIAGVPYFMKMKCQLRGSYHLEHSIKRQELSFAFTSLFHAK